MSTFELPLTNRSKQLRRLQTGALSRDHICTNWTRLNEARPSSSAIAESTPGQFVAGDATSAYATSTYATSAIAPGHTARVNILEALNEDCLVMIFEQNVFETFNLCVLARTCARFNVAAKRAFRARYKTHHFNLNATAWPLQECELLLRHFGELIESIEVESIGIKAGAYEDIVLGMVAYHWRNVERLRCHRYHLKYLKSRDNRKLRSYQRDLANGQRMLVYSGVRSPKKLIPYMRLPNLIDLHLDHMDLLDDNGQALQVFAEHKQLKRLAMTRVCSPLHVVDIVDLLPDLEELVIDGCVWNVFDEHRSCDYSSFGRLQSLKSFSMRNCSADAQLKLGALCDGNVQLERLTLHGLSWPSCITSMRTIKFLDYRFSFAIDLSPMIDFIVVNPDLAEIRLASACVTFQLVLNIVRNASRLKVLDIVFIAIREMDWSFISLNRQVIDAIDQMITARGIQLKISIVVSTRNRQTPTVEEVLRRYSEWLRVKF